MQHATPALAKYHELQKLLRQQQKNNYDGVSLYLRLTQLGLTDLKSLHQIVKKA